jgi:hypothetical protein
LNLEFCGNGFEIFMGLGSIVIGDLVKTVTSLLKESGQVGGSLALETEGRSYSPVKFSSCQV